MLIRGSVERRHFPHSGNSTDCGRPVYDDHDDDHDDCGAGYSDNGDDNDGVMVIKCVIMMTMIVM